MYRLASNVQIGLKCTDWPQMYRIGLKCTELASNVLCLKCTVHQMYCASNVQIGLKCTDWPQMYCLKCTVLQMYRLASNVQNWPQMYRY